MGRMLAERAGNGFLSDFAQALQRGAYAVADSALTELNTLQP